MGKFVIELDNVWKIYSMGSVAVNALQGLTLKVKKGEFVAVQGPSGSGKSTAVNMIGCLDFPSKGRVILDGKNISKLTESQLAKIRGKKIGFIFQKFNLIPTLTAVENVALPMIFQDVPEAKRIEKAKQLLTQVGLKERMFHSPGELSGGEQQRVAIARSLINDPEVVLADEATGNLDQKTGKIIMEFLIRLHKQGRTIIMVTHDDYLANVATRVEFLKDGMIVKSLKNGSKAGFRRRKSTILKKRI